MSIYGVTSATAGYASVSTMGSSAVKKNEETEKADSKAAVYEKDDTQKATGKRDTATIERLKKEAEEKTAQLRSLVEKMLTKQGKTYDKSTDIFSLLRGGSLEVDETTAANAAQEISADGYWGVEQTSDRLVSFAKALCGNDTSKADLLMDAMQKGFEQATKAWGDKLPDICQQTIDSAMEKMNAWKNGTEE